MGQDYKYGITIEADANGIKTISDALEALDHQMHDVVGGKGSVVTALNSYISGFNALKDAITGVGTAASQVTAQVTNAAQSGATAVQQANAQIVASNNATTNSAVANSNRQANAAKQAAMAGRGQSIRPQYAANFLAQSASTQQRFATQNPQLATSIIDFQKAKASNNTGWLLKNTNQGWFAAQQNTVARAVNQSGSTDYAHKKRVTDLKEYLRGQNREKWIGMLERSGGFSPENLTRTSTFVSGYKARRRADESLDKADRDRQFGKNADFGQSSKAFLGSIQQAASRVNLFSATMRGLGLKTAGTGTTLANALTNLSVNAAQFSGALHKQQDKFRALHYLGGSMVQQGMVMGAAGAGMVGGGMYLANEAGTFEQRKRGMTVLGGDDDLIAKIRKFDRESNVTTFDQAMSTAQQLLGTPGVGKDEVIPMMREVSDIVSLMGGTTDNFNAMMNQLLQAQRGARVTQQDVRAMSTSGGVPIDAIIREGLSAERYQKYVSGDESLSGKELIAAFREGVYKYKGGAAVGASQRGAESLPGQLSNLTSAFQQMAIAIGTRILPAVQKVVKGITWMFDAISALSNTPVLGQIIGFFTALFMGIGGVMVVLSPTVIALGYLSQAVSGAKMVADALTKAQTYLTAAQAAGGFSALTLAGQLGVLALAAYMVYQSIGWTNDALTQSEATWRKMHPTLAWITDAISALGDGINWLFDKIAEGITFVTSKLGLGERYYGQAAFDEKNTRDLYETRKVMLEKRGESVETYDQFKANQKAADQMGGGKSGGDFAGPSTSTDAGVAPAVEAMKDLNKEIAAQTADFKTTGLTNLPATGAGEPFSQERYDLERAAMGGDKDAKAQLRSLKLDDKFEAHESAAEAKATAQEERAAKRAVSEAAKVATQQKMAVLQGQIDAEQLRHHDEVSRIRAMHSMRAESRQKLMATENRAHTVKMQAFAAERRAIHTGMDFFRKAVAAMNAAMAPMQRDPRVQTLSQVRLQQLPDYAYGATGGPSRPAFDMAAWKAQKGENDAQWAAYRAKQAADKKVAADTAADTKKFAPLRGDGTRKLLPPDPKAYAEGIKGEKMVQAHDDRLRDYSIERYVREMKAWANLRLAAPPVYLRDRTGAVGSLPAMPQKPSNISGSARISGTPEGGYTVTFNPVTIPANNRPQQLYGR